MAAPTSSLSQSMGSSWERALSALCVEEISPDELHLRGSTAFQPAPRAEPVDSSVETTDSARFNADLWALEMPQGYASARRRLGTSHDTDVLDFGAAFTQLTDEYARGCNRLLSRLSGADDKNEHAARGLFGSPFGGHGGRPLGRSVGYASTQAAYAALQELVRQQGTTHAELAEELRLAIGEGRSRAKSSDEKKASFMRQADKAFADVRHAREAAKEDANAFKRALKRFQLVHAPQTVHAPQNKEITFDKSPQMRSDLSTSPRGEMEEVGADVPPPPPDEDDAPTEDLPTTEGAPPPPPSPPRPSSPPSAPPAQDGRAAAVAAAVRATELARSQEALLLHSAARASVESVDAANSLTRRFEGELQRLALIEMQARSSTFCLKKWRLLHLLS